MAIDLRGDLLPNLSALAQQEPMLQAAAAELSLRGEKIMSVSKRLAPVRNKRGGFLRSTGVVLPPEFSGSLVTVVLGYGAKYAFRTHENPRTGKTGGRSPSGKKYSSWSEVGQWHFLVDPYIAERDGALEGLAARVRESIQRRLAA